MHRAGTRKDPQGSSNRLVKEVSEYKDETMTRAAREERIAWHLANFAEWRHSLLSLGHYRAEYPYDVAHEYASSLDDWTTDPDYVWTKVHRYEYDEDGHEILRLRDTFFLWETEKTSTNRLDNRVVVKSDVYFDKDVVARLNLFTRQGSPKNVAVPDLAVLLPECELPRGEWRPLNDCVFRLGLGDPVPELVLQHLSTTMDWQRNGKLRLYEDLEVIEYLVYDPGGMRDPGSPAGLLVHRLENGAYRVIQPDSKLSEDLPAIEGEMFGAYIRTDRKPARDHLRISMVRGFSGTTLRGDVGATTRPINRSDTSEVRRLPGREAGRLAKRM